MITQRALEEAWQLLDTLHIFEVANLDFPSGTGSVNSQNQHNFDVGLDMKILKVSLLVRILYNENFVRPGAHSES